MDTPNLTPTEVLGLLANVRMHVSVAGSRLEDTIHITGSTFQGTILNAAQSALERALRDIKKLTRRENSK